jgi:hypothetical protein
MLKGNFYLFFVSDPFRFLECLAVMLVNKVILSSSLEDPSFEMPGIKYVNTIIQVISDFPNIQPRCDTLLSCST